MRILAIETSCDETGVAVIDASGSIVRPNFRVLANVVASQVEIHKPYGGVVPNLAKREHQKNLVPVLLAALKDAKLYHRTRTIILHSMIVSQLQEIFSHEPELLKQFIAKLPKLMPPEIDAIAVTYGPGLAPALWTGVNFARALATLWDKPLIPVNHLEGHIYINAIRGEKLCFPALALIVSGGHTELVLMPKVRIYRVIGETLDDAAGEAFDKVAKLMGLGYPGGPALSALADKLKMKNEKLKIVLPRPMINSKDFNFSFSGLKTAVLYLLRDQPKLLQSKNSKAAVAGEFQNAVVETLVTKTLRAAKEFKVKTVILGGGVAANTLLRGELAKCVAEKLPKANLLLPEISETTDNALMIAAAAFMGKKRKSAWRHLHADPGLRLDS
ncbi:MAG: hypothetical protein A3H71_03625 [Candidatus Sungbacteria bacterium RIFCSPLOWO2_02_FULL_48_13b]|uniref:tRNA N6-adenosine threonylcarbamoyltransferase n=2 Tax=Candidatus Sungiibacteriota TaxID=1817917 RepID=A0A1G2LGF0_9BACT|nr:MAG: hypothetical protein A3C12_03415 [Candidatus Sungbacteria bacterium RIFCSPHIGHO2_02_FULL_49_20]OHA10706.1 MAG: hypothetical protein A3H71_03625 [Candidatus Sungbacteria bacterium RIFCSPLOWO2_02_FULL_48_13b]